MSADQLGMKVSIKFSPESIFAIQGSPSAILRNVTEIHYAHNRERIQRAIGHVSPNSRLLEIDIAFESDIHSTGMNYQASDIAEYEATLETEKAESF